MRLSLLFLSLLLLVSGPALAQNGPETVTIDYADGKHQIREGLSTTQATDAFEEFLKSPVDGHFQVSEDGNMLMDARKVGEELQLTVRGKTDVGKVSEALANLGRARAAGNLGACRSNVKNIATAIGMWATDHQGQYPDSLGQLAPNYLVKMLSCPAATIADSYSPDYVKSEGRFVVSCRADHSDVALPKGLPAYDSDFGLIDSPSAYKEYQKP